MDYSNPFIWYYLFLETFQVRLSRKSTRVDGDGKSEAAICPTLSGDLESRWCQVWKLNFDTLFIHLYNYDKLKINRYMMLVLGPDEVYMFDRDNNVFQVPNLRFFYRKGVNVHLTDTLMDGVKNMLEKSIKINNFGV